MRKNGLIVIICTVIIIVVVGIIVNKNYSKANASYDDISELHIEDFKITLDNKKIDDDKILPSVTKLANKMYKYLPSDNADIIKKEIIENSIIAINNEWQKIYNYKIDQILVSNSFDAHILPDSILNNSKIDINIKDVKIVVVEAKSFNIDKYNYIYLYSKNNYESQYKMDSTLTTNLASDLKLTNSIIEYINSIKNDKITWVILPVK